MYYDDCLNNVIFFMKIGILSSWGKNLFINKVDCISVGFYVGNGLGKFWIVNFVLK